MKYKHIVTFFFLFIMSLDTIGQSKVKSKKSSIVKKKKGAFVPPKIVEVANESNEEIKSVEEFNTVAEIGWNGKEKIESITNKNKYNDQYFPLIKTESFKESQVYYIEKDIYPKKIVRDANWNYGLMDYQEKFTLPLIYGSIGHIHDKYLYVKNKNDKTALYHLENGFISEFKYRKLYKNVNCLTASIIKDDKELYGSIDYSNKILLPFEYTYLSPIENQELLDLIILTKDKFSGLYSILQKKWVIPIKYESIYQDNTTNLILVYDGKNQTLYDVKGNRILKENNYQSLNINNGTHIIFKKNDKYGVMDFDEKVIIPNEFKSIELFKENYFKAENLNNKIGYLELNGDTALNFEYDALNYLSKDNYIAKKNTKCGVVNISNSGIREIMVCDYDTISDFNDTKVIVSKNKKFGILSYTGKLSLPMIYDSLFMLSYYNDNINKYERIVVYKRENKYGLLDYNTYKQLTSNQYDEISISNKTLYTVINKKLGTMNLYGIEIIPNKFDDFRFLDETTVEVELNNKVGVIELSSPYKIILPIEFDAIVHEASGDKIGYKGKTEQRFKITKPKE